MAKNVDILASGTATSSSDADNAVATATLAAATGTRHCITGAVADYSAAVAAVKAVTFNWVENGTAKSLVVRVDFSKQHPAFIYLPGTLTGDAGEAVTVTLAASGTGGTTGRVSVFHSPIGG